MQSTLSHYSISEQIGAGGMGVVYRARDQRLGRDVAVKVLPAGALANEPARKRFRQEALALSKLNHPNIATIFDFDSENGSDFLVEELIPGLSLNEMLISAPLSQREIVNLGVQLAEGLAAAHEQGVIHRDLKPGNIRVTPDARLKILDFGLAKVLRTAGTGAEDEATASITDTQTISGTLPYMGPEQLLNQKLDTRTDLWAVGCVLYEMATGRRPFQGSGPALIEAILHQAPAPPSQLNHKIDPGLEAIILKCLEKDPALRYASAGEVAVDLRRLGSGVVTRTLAARRRWAASKVAMVVLVLVALAAGLVGWIWRQRQQQELTRIRSIAVLPLANLSGDPNQDYFADGVTDELINRLASMGNGLRIISRTSAMQYKGTTKSLPEIAHELNVQAVVEGAVLRSGNRVRITAQLINSADEQHLWAGEYNRDVRDILDLQAELAEAIAGKIELRLRPEEQARHAQTKPVDLEAYEQYLRGRQEWGRRDEASVRAALRHFRNAVGRDPNYAQAYAGMADCYLLLGPSLGAMPAIEALSEAHAAVTKALELDPLLPEAHVTLAQIVLTRDWDWTVAEVEFQRALALNPGYATAHHWYGLYLGSRGRIAEARQQLQEARTLDPLSPMIQGTLSWTYYIERNYPKADEILRQVLAGEPDFWVAHWGLGSGYVQEGRWDEAFAELDKAVELSGRNPRTVASLAYAYARHGRRAEAQRLLDDLTKGSRQGQHAAALDIAEVYVALGEHDRAFAWLEKAYAEHSQSLLLMNIDPWLDDLRSDPRFGDLARRIGFPK